MVSELIAGTETFLNISKNNEEGSFELDRTDSL